MSKGGSNTMNESPEDIVSYIEFVNELERLGIPVRTVCLWGGSNIR
jgi:hypothetical protein